MNEILQKPLIFNEKDTGYIICSNGEVYSTKTNKFLKKYTDRCGYVRVKLTFDGRRDSRLVSLHRLVASAFIPNPENKPDVNHMDGIKSHNYVSNLEWCTKSENIQHAISHGLKQAVNGERHGNSKYTDAEIESACKLMETGLFTLKEISKDTGVSMNTLYKIIDQNLWQQISCKYSCQNYKKVAKSYTREQFTRVFELLEENSLSPYDISDITGVSVNTIRHIYNNTFNNKVKHIDDLYDMYDISNYSHRDKKYSKSITTEMRADCLKLLNEGIKPKYIKRIVSAKYNINEEFIYLRLLA